MKKTKSKMVTPGAIMLYIVLLQVLACEEQQTLPEQLIPEKPAARLGKGDIERLAYSPDGKLLAIAGSIGVWLYDAVELREVGLLQGYIGRLHSVAFSPDGKTLASGGDDRDDRTVRLWDVDGQKQTGVLRGHTHTAWCVAFSSDGKTLASASSDSTIRLWDVQKQRQIGVLEGYTGVVQSVVFSPDGKTLASDGADNTVRLWHVQGQKQLGPDKGQLLENYSNSDLGIYSGVPDQSSVWVTWQNYHIGNSWKGKYSVGSYSKN